MFRSFAAQSQYKNQSQLTRLSSDCEGNLKVHSKCRWSLWTQLSVCRMNLCWTVYIHTCMYMPHHEHLLTCHRGGACEPFPQTSAVPFPHLPSAHQQQRVLNEMEMSAWVLKICMKQPEAIAENDVCQINCRPFVCDPTLHWGSLQYCFDSWPWCDELILSWSWNRAIVNCFTFKRLRDGLSTPKKEAWDPGLLLGLELVPGLLLGLEFAF